MHRSWEDFRKFDRLLLTHLVHPLGLSLPSEPSVASLDSYLTACLQHNNIVHSNVLHDFLGINWSGRDLLFLQSLPEFMKVCTTLYPYADLYGFAFICVYAQCRVKSSGDIHGKQSLNCVKVLEG